MDYPNIDDIEPIFKPYLLDALKGREKVEKAMLHIVEDVFVKSVGRIKSLLFTPYKSSFRHKKKDKILLKDLVNEKELDDLCEKEKKKIFDELLFIVEESLVSSLMVMKSPLARIKLDERIFLLRKKANGEMSEEGRIAGEADEKGSIHKKKPSIKEYEPIMQSIQEDLVKEAVAISKSAMQKVKTFNNKEFRLSSRLWDHSENSVATIKNIMKDNMNEDVTKIAKALDCYVKQGASKACSAYPNMMRRLKGRIPGYISFAAYRLARNEMAEATFTATLNDYKESPYIEAVQWLLANNRLKKYEDACCCNDLAYRDSYGLGHGIYPIDQVPDRPHVMCLCTLAPISSRKLKKAIKEGLKIGNVPTEEWLEKAKDERDRQAIKGKDAQLAFDFSQNIGGRKLKKVCINIIKEHEWFEKGVKDVDKKTFVEDLNKLTKEGLLMLARYTGEMKAELYYEGKDGSHYYPLKNQIYCNLTADAKRFDNKELGFKLGMKSFLHETGHWIDSNITGERFGLTSKMEKLYNTIQRDVINFINKVGREQFQSKFNPISNLDKTTLNKLGIVKQYVADKIKENIHINSNVSDIYGALTQNEIAGLGQKGRYGHSIEYWQYDDKAFHKAKVKMEFIAEAFESLCNKRRVDAMKEYLPSAWKEFNSTLTEIISRRKK